VVCLDAADRVLLLCWQDPAGGSRLWEPPGGGIQPGETPRQAAGRELAEETRLDPAALLDDRWVWVARDVRWNDRRYVGAQRFYLARFTVPRPALTTAGLLPDERVNLQGHAWVSRPQLADLPDRLEPPQLAAVVAALAPDTTWGSRPR
jgi:8-oxo-dGTP pyrophosphatase MutT (NUDIX family)